MKKISILSLITLSVLSLYCHADTVHVPADQPTIQAGIDAAVNGDVVLVAPGSYMENINFNGKAITVKSSDGAHNTLIDGGSVQYPDNGSVVTFNSGEGLDSVLDGFTLTNGTGSPYVQYGSDPVPGGGGVLCENSSPTLMNNTITQNTTISLGGGILAAHSSMLCINNIISHNMGRWKGGGLHCPHSSPTISGNYISDNFSDGFGGGICGNFSSDMVVTNNIICGNQGGYGGGIGCYSTDDITITNNIITGNVGDPGGGIAMISDFATISNNIIAGNWGYRGGGICLQGLYSFKCINNTVVGNTSFNYGGGLYTECSKGDIKNTIFWNNIAPAGREMWIGSQSYKSDIDISYSNVMGGQASVYVAPNNTFNWLGGIIDANPLFEEPINIDYHLTYESPCRDAGTHLGAGIPLKDFEGDEREYEGTNDIGADEFHPHLYCTGTMTPYGIIYCNIVGIPQTSPSALFVGSGVLETPIQHGWGAFHLEAPWWVVPLNSHFYHGIHTFSEVVPVMPAPPYDIPMQALVGDVLTNLYVLEIR